MLHCTSRPAWAFGFLLASVLSLSLEAAATPKPNIVMIMTDDLDMSVWSTALQLGYMPNAQSHLVDKGTTFTETFVALSTCCPSRSTFFTGQYPHNHGVIRNSGPKGGFQNFAGDDSTIAVWLHNAGYRTGLIGKYLNGYGASDLGGSYIPPGWDTWQALFTVAQFDYSMTHNGTIVSYGAQPQDYQTDVVANLAEAFIRANDPRPFFLTLTPSAPHYESASGGEDDGRSLRPAPRYATTPAINPIPTESSLSFNEANMTDKPAWMRKVALVDPVLQREGYNSKLVAMRSVDDLIGQVFATLQDEGVLDNTLVIFTSDNGYQYGTHRRIAKTDLYDESIRLPMVIRAPGQSTPRVVSDWAMNTDWAPTIVDYARASAGRVMDGRSLRGLVEGTNTESIRRSLLVELPSDDRISAEHRPFLMIRSKDPALTLEASGHKVLIYARTLDAFGTALIGEELYDLDADPSQLASLHKSTLQKRIDQKAKLAARLQQLKACAGDTCRSLEN